MKADLQQCCVNHDAKLHTANGHDRRVEELIDRFPRRLRLTVRWLRRPSSVWIRTPAGILLICGGLFGFLPIFRMFGCFRSAWFYSPMTFHR